MKKIFLTVILILLFFAASAHAEDDSTSARYFRHVTGWYDVDCEKIYIEKNTLRFYLDSGEMTGKINAEAIPLNTTDKTITYSSSDENLVTVDNEGNVSVKNVPGKAEITVTCSDKIAIINVEIIRGVTGVSLSANDLTFYADRPANSTLTAFITPTDATDKTVTWKSSDTAVAAVDENGTITPCGIGTASITVTTADGGFKAECIVRVTKYDIPVRAVFIENAIEALRINGDYQLTSYVYPENARDKSVTWSSSDPNVVTVDSNGNIKGISEGNAMISVASKNGKEDTFTINIVPDDSTPFVFNMISRPVSERIAELSMPVIYTNCETSLESAIETQLSKDPTVFTTTASPASKSDVEKYIVPANFNSGSAKYQFAVLSGTNGVSETFLNAYLSDKGVLAGKANIFIEAAKQFNISEIYLAVHASLESGNGTSELATGINYNGTTVYNMFGIGAYDNDPINEGAKYAYDNGWTSVEAAIYGGAKWISENYINAPTKQNTLYKMRWNPLNPGIHQYATDVAWAIKQSGTISAMFGALPESSIMFDVPVYNGEAETPISYD